MSATGPLVGVAGDQFTTALSTGCDTTNYCTDFARDAAGNFIIAARSELLTVTPSGVTAIPAPEGSRWVSVALDSGGNYIVADDANLQILRISPSSPSSPQVIATFPTANDTVVRVDSAGNYVLATDDVSGGISPGPISLFRITPGAGTVTCSVSTPVTGCAPVTITGTPPESAGGLTFDANGNYVVVDSVNAAVYRITPGGVSSSLIPTGNGVLRFPRGISRDPASGYYFVVDQPINLGKALRPRIAAGVSSLDIFDPTGNNLTRILSAPGLLEFPAGVLVVDSVSTGSTEYVFDNSPGSGSGPVVNIAPAGGNTVLSCPEPTCPAPLATGGKQIFDATTDSAGNFILAAGSALVKVTQAGVSSQIATVPLYSISNWVSVAIDEHGNYIVVDAPNGAIDRISPDGSTITTVEYYTLPSSSDSPANVFVRIDGAGNYIVAEENGGLPISLFRISPSATTSEMSPAVPISLTGNVPTSAGGLALDESGNYIVTNYALSDIVSITPAGAATLLYANLDEILSYPAGIYRDPASGNFAIADQLGFAYLLSPDGSELSPLNTAPYSLWAPVAVASLPANPLRITTGSLSSGTSGTAYAPVTLAAAGGSGGYSWSASGLPSGLTLNASTGVLSGNSPAAPGNSNVIVTLTDTVSNLSVFRQFPLSFTTAANFISVSSPITGPISTAVGASVSVDFTVTGGAGGYSWSVSGQPSGINISSAGVLSGIVAQGGIFNVFVSVTDSQGNLASTIVTMNVLGLATSSLPNGTVGLFYAVSLNPQGGNGSYTVSASGLPPGLIMTGYGYLNGTPKTAGSYPISFTITSGSVTGTESLTLTVANPGPLSISSTSLPAGTVNAYYSQGLAATGGLPPYTWSIIYGSLPQGLSMNKWGTVSGSPASAVTASFGVQATDTTGGSVTATVTLAINPAPLQITTQSLPSGMTNVGYPNQVFSVSGGMPPYVWSAGAGTLPAGLALSNSGTLGGTPTGTGTFSPAITVSDSGSPANTATITPNLTIRANSTDLILTSGALTFSIAAPATILPSVQTFGVQSTAASQQLSYSLAVSPAVPWLSVVNGTGTPDTVAVSLTQVALSLAAGTYQTTLTATCTSSVCQGHTQSVAVALNVTSTPPELKIGTSLLSFATSSVNTGALTQPLVVTNGGGGTIGFGSFSCEAAWCVAGAPPAYIGGGASATIPVSVNPGLLSGGYYRTQIDVVTSAGSASVPVTLFAAPSGSMTLAPAGEQFSMQAGGTLANPSDSFLVSVNSANTVSWSASVVPTPESTTVANWLVLGASSGTSTATSPGAVPFSVDATAASALAPGAYYAQVQVTSPDVNDSPLVFEVVLNVMPAGTAMPANPAPGGLLFITNVGGTAPAQTVTANAGSSASAATASGGAWLSVAPGASPGVFNVSVNTNNLAVGVYMGGVSVSNAATAVQTVNVTLIVASQGGSDISGSTRFATLGVTSKAAGCAPSALVPTQTELVNNFSTPAAWPTPLAILLVNDCGAAVNNGQIVATFTNGDPPLALNLADPNHGLYSGTWSPGKPSAQVAINVRASAPGYPNVTAQIAGAVVPNAVPVLTPNGTVHSFDPLVGGALAPGTIVAIYGQNLASQTAQPTSIPLLNSVNGTTVIIGGLPAPLYYLSAGQINAQIPFELQAGQQYQVIVSANGALTTPNPIQLVGATPGLAAFADNTLIAQHGDGTLVSQTSPARGGEYLVAYLAGMGDTSVTVASGAASPSTPLAMPNDSPLLTINGNQSPIAFAGLTPGLVGLYQMNFQAPTDLPAGNITLVVAQSGQNSNQTNLPYQP